MATKQTFEQFLKTIRPEQLGPDGKFLAPKSGTNFQAEGLTPREYYDLRINDKRDTGRFQGSGDDMSSVMEDVGSVNADWVEGPRNNGMWGGLTDGVNQMINDKKFQAGLAAVIGGGYMFGGESLAGAGATAGGGATGAAADFGAGTYAAGATPSAATAATAAAPAAAGLSSVAPGTIGSGTFALDASIPEMASSVVAGPGTTMSTGFYGPGLAGGATDAAGAIIGSGTAAEGAAAIAAANSGMPIAEIAKKWGPSIAKMVIAGGASAIANDGGATGGGVNANVDSMISSALGNTKSMENDYNTLFKPWAIEQVGKATQRGDAGYDALTGLASAPNKNLAAYQTYVDRVGSQGYRDGERGKAMAEVQQQSDIGLGSARRAAMARGVDPGKFALQANANSINTAAAKTKAAADAEGLAWDQFGKGAQTAAGMHIADTNNRANLITGANALGAQGLNAGTKLATVDGAYRGGLSQQYNSTLGAVTGAKNSENAQSNYEREHGLSGVINAGIATAATKWLTDKGGDAIGNFFSS